MKRIIAFSLTVVLLVIALMGCEETSTDNASKIAPIESYDEESRVFIDTASVAPDNSAQSPSSGSFLVKEKKFVYFENDLVLLDITNETEINYTVTIIGKYLDANGNVLKTETQSFEGFAANYQTYFLFMPKINFANFSYEIDVQPFDGECPASEINILDGKRRIDKWTTQQTMHQLITSIEYQNKSNHPLTAALTCILFDKNGDIYYICMPGIKEAGAGETAGPSIKMYVQYSENDFVYPERLNNDYVEILAFANGVFASRDEMLAWLNSEGNQLTEWYNEYEIPTDDFRK